MSENVQGLLKSLKEVDAGFREHDVLENLKKLDDELKKLASRIDSLTSELEKVRAGDRRGKR